MSVILGISAYFHDSSAALLVDGTLVAAASEERFSRIKYDASLPLKSVAFCLSKANLSIDEVDEVVFFEKPFTKFERILDTSVRFAPYGFVPFQKAIRSWLKSKFWVADTIRKQLHFKGNLSFSQHHLSHAALAAYTGPYDSAAIVIMDGVGERACTTIGVYENGKVQLLQEQRFPHSIGLLYSAFTYFCGFKVNGGEYKLMGLAPYGTPRFTQLIRDHVVKQKDDGSIELNLEYFRFHKDVEMTSKKMESLFGVSKRKPEDELLEIYKDIAASIQEVTQQLVLQLIHSAHQLTGKKHLLIGGGVALNCVINQAIISQTPFESYWLHSASGDSGCALGAALWREGKPISSDQRLLKAIDFLGPSYSDKEIEESILQKQLVFSSLSDEELIETSSDLLKNGKVLGWFQGAMEVGPRALGNRSILAHPGFPDMQKQLNLKIKKREGFRPFAPIVTAESAADYFDLQEGVDYSRMTTVAKAKQVESMPSCVHVDGTSRIQVLAKTDQTLLHQLLVRFGEKAGIPVLINTSFNERGEPMVCSPNEAIACFFNTEMDALVIGNKLILKSENAHIQHQNNVYALD
ncbi:MAG: hypothetical protein IT221_05855 [Fluviicola sp.]|nr:hypothetical protein [Fluviicola sp.]